ncbi:hypothetical protein ONS95_013592 [Cadophora gregata]|uniref:uncharacterized protein n=1 Tax=Cadophora gregata TaxID=51156 RepID=UPI0026DC71FF|nr:uncharacterized protein ONS95_013592 [Cadophora gregata]KAK0114087.1 hypothetical protein ONS95_013592 [Cadophora gregata]
MHGGVCFRLATRTQGLEVASLCDDRKKSFSLVLTPRTQLQKETASTKPKYPLWLSALTIGSGQHTVFLMFTLRVKNTQSRWTIRVLRQFTHVLSKTIDSWDTFKDGEIRYLNLPDSENLADATWGNLLAAIDKDVIELRDLRSSLQHKTELFENMTNSIVTHAAHAETIITRLQSQFIQALTVITIFYLPPTLASSIFSMQDSIFTNPKFKDWLFTLLGLFMATALLVLAVLTFNHPRISTWLLQVWASVTRVPTHLLQVFLSIRWASNRDGQLGQDPEEIEMDEQDDPDAPGAGQV